MNYGEALHFWAQWLGWLAVEITLVIAIVAAWQLLTASAHRRRIIWQSGLLGAAMLLVFESTGIGPGVAHWVLLRIYINPATVPTTPPATVAKLQTSGALNFSQANLSAEPLHPAFNQSELPAAATAAQNTSWWPAAVWFMGTVLLLARVLFNYVMVLVFRCRNRVTDDEILRERVRLLAGHLGLRRRVTVLESARLTSPIAFGVFFPAICVPKNFSRQFSEQEQNVILAHELGHLLNNDPGWYMVTELVTAMLWWHPLVWWVRRQIHAASETAADDTCLILQDGPVLLAECLVTVGNRLTAEQRLGWMSMTGNGFKSALGQRVVRLLNLGGQRFKPLNRAQAWAAKALGALALAALAVVCAASATLPALDRPMARSLRASWDTSVAGRSMLAALGTDNPLALVETKTKPVDRSAVELRLAQVGKKSKDTSVPNPLLRTNQIYTNVGRQKIKSKLDSIVLPELRFDGATLPEAILFLHQEAKRLDPDKKGVNLLLLSYYREDATEPPLDLETVKISINPPLNGLTLAQALDVVTKASSRPLRTSLEDYAVVIYSGSATGAGVTTRIYRTDPNMFQQGLENVGPRVTPGTGNGGQNNSGGQNSNPAGGVIGVSPTSSLNSAPAVTSRQKMLAKLDSIVLPEVAFDGPLAEVLIVLQAQARKLDPEKRGVDLVIQPQDGPGVDLESVNVKISPPLRDITLGATIGAVVHASEYPIQFSIEDQAVVFSEKPLVTPARATPEDGDKNERVLQSSSPAPDNAVKPQSLNRTPATRAPGAPVQAARIHTAPARSAIDGSFETLRGVLESPQVREGIRSLVELYSED